MFLAKDGICVRCPSITTTLMKTRTHMTHPLSVSRILYLVSRILLDVTMFYNVIRRGQPLRITNTIWQWGIPPLCLKRVVCKVVPNQYELIGWGLVGGLYPPNHPYPRVGIPPASGGLPTATGKGSIRGWEGGNWVATVKIWSSR